jgi:hypothetical protein
MSTVKITDLASKTLATNTANTIFVGVDLPTGVTGKYTAKDLADNLYSNNVLNVGNTIAFADGTTQNTSFAAAASYANAAFLKANAAFLVANTPDAIANSAALYANGAFIQSNAAFLVANTPTHVANSAALYANGAFIQSNAAFLVANTPTHVANSAALYANGAFAKANAALANTTGPFAGDLTFTGVVTPVKGFVYIPTVLVGNQTAFTIDYSTTSLIKATLVADLTISHSNYVYGKVVEVWLTNTGGATRTVTHGCTATNSSTNSTTFDMPATSSAYLRYFSINGDNANTFVAVQSA